MTETSQKERTVLECLRMMFSLSSGKNCLVYKCLLVLLAFFHIDSHSIERQNERKCFPSWVGFLGYFERVDMGLQTSMNAHMCVWLQSRTLMA